MSDATGLTVQVDLRQVRLTARDIHARTRVPVIAVVKADAYGLGGRQVARSLAKESCVEGFYVLTLAEAIAYGLPETGKPTIAVEPYPLKDASEYIRHHVRPTVWQAESAAQLRSARPVLSVDTGMQRFAADPSSVDAILSAGQITEAMTHATRLEHVHQLQQAIAGHSLKLHAAGTALLSEPAAWLDAVRPGVSLYRDAVRVTAPLYQVRNSSKPAGYTGFLTPRHGLILAGYEHGLRPGPCVVNGRPTQIIEVGMQTSFIELLGHEKPGDPVTLLGPGAPLDDLAKSWSCGPHEVLLRLCAGKLITYLGE